MPGNFHAVPESVVESWPPPNFVDPVRRTWMPEFVLTWQIASSILLFGRFYLRANKKAGSFGLDDLFVGVGWIFSIGLTTTAWIGAQKFDLDRHTWDVHPELYVGAAMTGWIAQVTFVFSTVPTKLSVLLFYRRMVKESLNKRWLHAIYAALALTTAYGIAVFLTYCLICMPLSAYWESYDFSYDKPFKCINGNALTVTSGVLSVLSDLYSVAVPCLMLRHYDLDVPRRQKIALNAVFSMGLLVTGAGIARTYYLWRINHTYDTSWTGFTLYAWSIVECQLALICACAPSCRAFFRHYLRDAVRRGFSSVSNQSRRRSMRPDPVERQDNDWHVLRSQNGNEKEMEHGPVEQVLEAKESRPTTWGTESSDDGLKRTVSPKITSPEEYELYNVERLHRAGFRRSRVLEFDMVKPDKDCTEKDTV